MSCDGLTNRAVYEYRQEQKKNRKYSPWKWVTAIVIGAMLAGCTYFALNYTVVERFQLEQRR